MLIETLLGLGASAAVGVWGWYRHARQARTDEDEVLERLRDRLFMVERSLRYRNVGRQDVVFLEPGDDWIEHPAHALLWDGVHAHIDGVAFADLLAVHPPMSDLGMLGAALDELRKLAQEYVGPELATQVQVDHDPDDEKTEPSGEPILDRMDLDAEYDDSPARERDDQEHRNARRRVRD